MLVETELAYMGFNQDYTCIAIGTSTGFCIFNTYPLSKFYSRSKS